MSGKTLALIPARLGSTRFPRKLLARLGGQSLLEMVWRSTRRARMIDDVFVATDSDEIAETAAMIGAAVIRTRSGHSTGSDRVAEAVRGKKASLVVNVQGDNVGLAPAALTKLVTAMQKNRHWPVGTLVRRCRSRAEFLAPSKVKAVLGADQRALWFSRAPLPLPPSGDSPDVWRAGWIHIGVYAFRPKILARFHALPKGRLETIESLEQLRLLEAGIPIFAEVVANGPLAIDTPSDLARARRLKTQRMVR